MVFFIKYGCSQTTENLIVEANDYTRAEEYAIQSAQDSYYSYDCNYLNPDEYPEYDEEELNEYEWQDMQEDIYWEVVPFDKNDEEHLECLREQDNVPFSV